MAKFDSFVREAKIGVLMDCAKIEHTVNTSVVSLLAHLPTQPTLHVPLEHLARRLDAESVSVSAEVTPNSVMFGLTINW